MELSGDLSRTAFASERLTLRAFAPSDAAESFAAINERIARYMSWNPPASEPEYEAIWQGAIADMKAGRQLSLVIRLKETGAFIGSAGLHPADGGMLETGIWIKETAQGQGCGREAVAVVIAWASREFGPSGFLWPVVDENTPSCRLAESLGGEIIGTRQRQKAADQVRTVLLYRIPPKE